jgi:uncharacterized protein YndB with AHSA1/START domain
MAQFWVIGLTKVEASVVIDRPVEVVWNFITDLSKAQDWYRGVLEERWTSLGPPGVGATLEAKLASRLMRVVLLRVVEYEPHRKFVMEFTSGQVRGTTDGFSLETIEGKTKLTETLDLKLGGFFRLVGPLLGRRGRNDVAFRHQNLKRILESKAQS